MLFWLRRFTLPEHSSILVSRSFKIGAMKKQGKRAMKKAKGPMKGRRPPSKKGKGIEESSEDEDDAPSQGSLSTPMEKYQESLKQRHAQEGSQVDLKTMQPVKQAPPQDPLNAEVVARMKKLKEEQDALKKSVQGGPQAGKQPLQVKRELEDEDSTRPLKRHASDDSAISLGKVAGREIVPFKGGKPMSLEEKMMKFRSGKLGEDDFNKDDWHGIAGKFNYARKGTLVGQKLDDAYKKFAGEGRSLNRRQARYFMLAWMKSPSDVESVLETVKTIEGSEGCRRELPWLTEAQVIEVYGMDKAQELFEDDLLQTRDDPNNKKWKQYQLKKDTSWQEAKKGHQQALQKNDKVTGEDGNMLEDAWQNTSFNFSALRNAAKDMGLNLEDACKDQEFLDLLNKATDAKATGPSSGKGREVEDASQLSFQDMKARILQEQEDELKRLKEEKLQKRTDLAAKRAERDAEVGLTALSKCADPREIQKLTKDDINKKIKEVLMQGNKAHTSASILKPKLTKDKVSTKVLREFQSVYSALKASYEAMLTAKGLFESGKCKDAFAARAISSLARNVQEMRKILEGLYGPK